MTSYKEIIQLIREKPNLYLSQRSIFDLESFLTGWTVGNQLAIPDLDLKLAFQGWIQKKYRITSSQSWARIILFYSIDDFSAFENFFKLHDSFMEEYGNLEK